MYPIYYNSDASEALYIHVTHIRSICAVYCVTCSSVYSMEEFSKPRPAGGGRALAR
jgi:hypothetical protein